jgi:hypothetical protein
MFSSRRRFSFRVFLSLDLVSRGTPLLTCRNLSGMGGRAHGLGMAIPPGDGPAGGLPLLITRAKNLYDLKTCGLGISSFSDFPQHWTAACEARGNDATFFKAEFSAVVFD